MRPGPEADRTVSPSSPVPSPSGDHPTGPSCMGRLPDALRTRQYGSQRLSLAAQLAAGPTGRGRGPRDSSATVRIAVMRTALGSCSVLLAGLAAPPPKSGQQRAGPTAPPILGHPPPASGRSSARGAAAPSPAGWSTAKRQAREGRVSTVGKGHTLYWAGGRPSAGRRGMKQGFVSVFSWVSRYRLPFYLLFLCFVL